MDKLQEFISRRNELINGSGGKKEGGTLSARERINLLFDEGSFIETDLFSGMDENYPTEGVITGYGTVDSRLVFAYSQDSSISGGSFTKGQADKICKTIDNAIKTGAPCVALLDSKGTKLDEGISALAAMGEVYKRNIKASGSILQISAIFGTCAGGATYAPSMADFVFMTEKSHMMLNGAALCSGEGNIVTEDEIGSAEVNASESGTVHFVAKDDADCMAQIRNLIMLLPSNSEEYAPETACSDDLNRLSDSLSFKNIDAKSIINQVVDGGIFTEVSALYAKNIVTGFAKINGRTVAIVANNGELDIKATEKASDFIKYADSFNIPVLTFCDTEGYKASACQEKHGLSKYAAKLAYAYGAASVPKVTVICGYACGNAAIAMGSLAVGADFVLAWADSVIGALSPKMASVLLYNDTIKASANPKEEREKVMEYYADNVATAIEAAKAGFVDDVIEPDSTRPRVAAALEMLYGKRDNAPCKKHGSFRG